MGVETFEIIVKIVLVAHVEKALHHGDEQSLAHARRAEQHCALVLEQPRPKLSFIHVELLLLPHGRESRFANGTDAKRRGGSGGFCVHLSEIEMFARLQRFGIRAH